MIIEGKLTLLRAPELKDVPALNRWSNDPEIWNMLGGWHFPYSMRSTEEWVNTRSDNNQNDHVFCIETHDEGIIGTANIINIDWKNRNAFHGLMIGNVNSRGKGYAFDALMAIMRYAFMELGLNRLDTEIIKYNTRSIKFYTEKGGWKKEGVRRNWFFRNGQYHDKIIVGVTYQDYQKLMNRINYWI